MGYPSPPEISLEILTEANISYTLSIKYVVSQAAWYDPGNLDES